MSSDRDPSALPPDTILIADGFFGYASDIVRELERRGRRVVWFKDRPATDTVTKFLLRISPVLLASRAAAYYRGIPTRVEASAITQVLMVKAESASVASIEHLRRALPNAEFTLYFWDSYRNMSRDSRQKVGLFDRALSFDQVDVADDSRLHYRPLFYTEELARVEHPDIDFLFVGTAHTDRYAVLKRLEEALPGGASFKWLLYYPSRRLFRLRRSLDRRLAGSSPDEFFFQPLDRPAVRDLVRRSRVAVDIERAIQSGFTMRTIEMLGARRKLLTTNPEAADADFFRPGNVAVFDRADPKLPNSFLTSPYQELPDRVRYRYSLQGWLDEVLPCTREADVAPAPEAPASGAKPLQAQ